MFSNLINILNCIQKVPTYKVWWYGITEWDFKWAGPKNTIIWHFCDFRTPLKSPLKSLLTPNFCGHFLSSIQAYYTLKIFKDHIRL